jgi:hypothetical protein
MSTTHTVAPSSLDSTPSPTANPADQMSGKKGLVTKCHACKNADLPAPKRVYCRFCLTNGYVAACLPCNGTGIVNALAAWDGKSKHGSTCLTCGGMKCIPARVEEFEAQAKAKIDEPVIP